MLASARVTSVCCVYNPYRPLDSTLIPSTLNMKVCIILFVLVAAAVAEAPLPSTAAAPAPAPVFRPSGRLLLLPSREEESAAQPQPTPVQEEKAALVDSGEYYVLLPDGRLQMVKYTTLPLTESAAASQQVKEAVPQPQYKLNYVQFPLPGSQQFTQSRLELVPVPAPVKEEADKEEEVSGFQAKLQYRDVKPISAPIYAYNPAPLVRILRK